MSSLRKIIVVVALIAAPIAAPITAHADPGARPHAITTFSLATADQGVRMLEIRLRCEDGCAV